MQDDPAIVAAPWGPEVDGRRLLNLTAGREFVKQKAGKVRMKGINARLTWLGGARMLEHVERTRATLLTHRPTLGAGDVAAILWRTASWRSDL